VIANIHLSLNILYTGCVYPAVKVRTVAFPAHEVLANAASNPRTENFINFESGVFCDSHRCQLFVIKQIVNYLTIQIFQLVHRSRCPTNYLDYSKHLRGIILLTAIGKLHFFFTNAHMLFHVKFRFCNRDFTVFLFIVFKIARTSESVTRAGAMPVVLCTVA
jgi:hypothetical protein